MVDITHSRTVNVNTNILLQPQRQLGIQRSDRFRTDLWGTVG